MNLDKKRSDIPRSDCAFNVDLRVTPVAFQVKFVRVTGAGNSFESEGQPEGPRGVAGGLGRMSPSRRHPIRPVLVTVTGNRDGNRRRRTGSGARTRDFSESCLRSPLLVTGPAP
jgi:hypothetical protein